MANEEFTNLLLELAATSFLLHFTTEQNWAKIQQEGLVPQENRQKNLYQSKSSGSGGSPLRCTLIKINILL